MITYGEMTIFWKTLRDMRGGMLWTAVGMGLCSVLFMAMFPSIEETAADLQEVIDKMGPVIQALTGGSGDFSTLDGFLSVKLLSLTYPAIMLAVGIGYGASLIAGEEEYGSLDVLLSAPVKRWRMALEKFLALVTLVIVVLIGTYAGLIGGGLMVGVNGMDAGHMLIGVANMIPFTLFFAALAFCLTALHRGNGVALYVPASLASMTYIVNALSEVTDIPQALLKLSPWHYYNGIGVLNDGVNVGGTILLLGLTVLLVGVSLWGIERRDIGA